MAPKKRMKARYRSIDPFIRLQTVTIGPNTVSQGDIIKIRGEYGVTFKFLHHVTNPANGAEWIDCVELWRGQNRAIRSFRAERVKVVPKRRKRGHRRKDAQAS